jgi:hypothetical protein
MHAFDIRGLVRDAGGLTALAAVLSHNYPDDPLTPKAVEKWYGRGAPISRVVQILEVIEQKKGKADIRDYVQADFIKKPGSRQIIQVYNNLCALADSLEKQSDLINLVSMKVLAERAEDIRKGQ